MTYEKFNTFHEETSDYVCVCKHYNSSDYEDSNSFDWKPYKSDGNIILYDTD